MNGKLPLSSAWGAEQHAWVREMGASHSAMPAGGGVGASAWRGTDARRPSAAARAAADKVRQTRERLALQAGETTPAFDYELLLMFVRNELGASVTVPLLAVIFALAAMFWAPVVQPILWLASVLAAKAWLIWQCRRFARLPAREVDPTLWRKRLTLAELANGIAWGGIAFIAMDTPDPSSHVFIFAAITLVLAIRTMFASTVVPIIYAGTIPMTIALSIRLMAIGTPFYWALASMALGVHVYFIFLARGLNATVLAMLGFRAEKDSLIAELEEAKAVSDDARRRAEAANLAKSRFLATMSHELRTPLNAILGFSEVMKNELLGPMGSSTYRDYAANIHESGSHLLNLINEILDLSRIEAGRYELNEQPVRLAEVGEECRRLLKLRAEAKGLEVIERFADALPPLWADERAVRQVTLNLLSNALKFTPRGGTVVIIADQLEDGHQYLSVQDNGPGIPEDEIPKVMRAFGQGTLAQNAAEGGTGLGLPIVKHLMELHGGELRLESRLRKGTKATVVFPPSRVIEILPPLQPLGEERHRRAEG